MIKYTIIEKAKALGYNKTSFANAAGISAKTISKISKNEMISLDIIDKCCNVLDCQPGDILSFKKETNNQLLDILREEKAMNLRGGLYHKTQILIAYNSNHIEGSKLSEEQTRYIYETNTIGMETDNSINIDDIIETANHFDAFRYILDIADKPLSENIIKEIHKILKTGTSDARKDWFMVGDYKLKANEVGGIETSLPKNVKKDMQILLEEYLSLNKVTEEDIIKFHYKFERIHPFQDGNGRVGRLIMFKECLRHNYIPFIIEDEFKEFYYRGLKNYKEEPGYLVDTCFNGQDRYKAIIKYFVNN